MDGLEILKAMRDGKIAVCVGRGFTKDVVWEDQYRYKDPQMQTRRIIPDSGEVASWGPYAGPASLFMKDLNWTLKDPEPEFDLTFVQAFKAMLEGKKVCNAELPSLVQYIEDGRIYSYPLYEEDLTEQAHITIEEQEAMWRVVE